ncbi:MAG: hypothetical protein ND895_28820, partial [Pyrinomonadaceae bacterium]|nr:hypothetical protein [Pyrinomonadaceae bacterium]
MIEPLIYRVAVNDVAGLFVRKAQEESEPPPEDLSSRLDIEAPTNYFQEVTYQIREPRVSPGHKARPR